MSDFYFYKKDGTMIDPSTMGIHMGEGFISALDTIITPKEVVTNESRLTDGVTELDMPIKASKREITLNFVILGETETKYRGYRLAFQELLMQGRIGIQIPTIGAQIYKLSYISQTPQYALNRKRTCGRISVKFVENNPRDRQLPF